MDEEANVYEYICQIGLEDEFSDICNTKEEVDAVVLCLWVIDQGRYEYRHAIRCQPKDPTGRQNKLDTLLKDAITEQERHDIIAEREPVYHSRSTVKDVKYYILDICMKILEDIGMGVKRRKKLLPRLTKYLLEDRPDHDTTESARIRLLQNRLEALLEKK